VAESIFPASTPKTFRRFKVNDIRDGRRDAHAIVAVAIESVCPDQLVGRRLAIEQGMLRWDHHPLTPPLRVARIGRVAIVGGGKAAAGMAAGIVRLLARGGVEGPRVAGIVSVPEGSGLEVPGIEVRQTRPASRNLPTPQAVAATQEMLTRLGSLGPNDLAIALVSGGGSALMAAPRAGVPLEEKVAVAEFLTAAGADIRQLNTVRRAASDVKGGGLARACTAGRLLVLVLSDVIGDSLESIASGPCLPGAAGASEAMLVLERFGAVAAGVAPKLVDVLRSEVGRGLAEPLPTEVADAAWTTPRGCSVTHLLLGSNATAINAAAMEARRRGYAVTVRHADPHAEETADEVGIRLVREGLTLADRHFPPPARDHRPAGLPRAIIEGGEAIVRLPASHGTGGRNQQTCLAALEALRSQGIAWPEGLLVASIGTDGEDGPTTAAGGIADAAVAAAICELGLDAARALADCDAHPLLQAAGGLVVTGPSGTNVADLRLILAQPQQGPA
jgi:glycerate 2-kinase